MADRVRIEFEGDVSDLESKLSDTFGDLGKDAGDNISEGVKKGSDEAASAAEDAAGRIDDAYSNAGEGAADGFSAVGKAARDAADDAGEAFGQIPGEAQKAGTAAGEAASSGFSGIGKAARSAGDDAGSAFSGIGAAARGGAEQAGNAFSGIGAAIRGGIQSAADGASSVFSGIGAAARQGAQQVASAFSGVGQAVSGQLSQVQQSMDNAFNAGKNMAGNLPPLFSQLGGSIAAVAGPATVLSKGFERLNKEARAEIMFKNVGLTAGETASVMSDLNEIVTGTSVSLADAASTASMLAQGGVEIGPAMNDAMSAMTNLSSIAQGTGVDVGSVMVQMKAAGKLMGGDAMQLQNAGINIYQFVADHMGKSVDEVKNMEIDFETVVAAINSQTGDLGQELGVTLPAMLSNMGTAFARLGAVILGPFMGMISSAVGGITKAVSIVGKVLGGFFDWLNGGSIIADTFKYAIIALSAAIAVVVGPAAIAAVFGFVKALIMGSTVMTTMILPALAGLKAAITAAFVTSPIGWVVLAIMGVVAAIMLLWKHSEAFRDFFTGLWEKISEPVINAFNTIKDAWDGLVGIFKGEARPGMTALEQLIGADKVAWIIDKVTTVKQVWEDLKTAFSGGDVPGGGALARLVGIDTAERVMEIIGNIKGAWQDLLGAFRGDGGGGDALRAIFGDDAGGAILNVFERLGDAARWVWDSIKSIGSALSEAGAAIGSAAWSVLQSVFSSLVEVGKSLWSALTTILSAVWDLIQALMPVLMPVLKVIGAIIVGTVVVAFFVLMGALKIVAGVFKVLASVISWVAENILGPLIGAIGALVGWLVEKLGGVIAWVVERFTWLIEFFSGVASGIGDAFSAVAEWIGNAFSTAWQWLQESWESIGQPIVDFIKDAFLIGFGLIVLAFQFLREKWDELWQLLVAGWEAFGQPIVDWVIQAFAWLGEQSAAGLDILRGAWDSVWAWLTATWQAYGQPIVDWVIGAFNWMGDALAASWQWVQDRFTQLWQWAGSVWQSYGQPVIDWIIAAWQRVSGRIQAYVGLIRGYIQLFADKMMELWNRYVQPVVDWVVNAFNEITDTVRGWKDAVLGAVSDAGSWLLQAGKDMVQGFINGITSMVSNVVNAAKDLGNKAKDAAKSALGINSPSRVFTEIGEQTGDGMVRGLQSRTAAVAQAAQEMAAAAANVNVPKVEVPGVAVAAPAMAAPAMAAPVVAAAPSMAPAGSTGGGSSEGGDMAQPTETLALLGPAGMEASAALQASIMGLAVPSVDALGLATQNMATLQVLPSLSSVSTQALQTAMGAVAPATAQMMASMSTTGALFQGAANGQINPALGSVQTMVWGVLNQGVIPATAQMMASMSTTGSRFQGAANGQINPALGSVQTMVWGVLNQGVIPATNGMMGAIANTANAFGVGARNIATQWNQVREATAQPVRFVIRSVFNDGLVGMWNSVSDLLGTKKMGSYPIRFASGGILPGYTPGRDPYTFVEPNSGMSIGLSGGEAIMRPEVTRALGTSRVDSLNSAARMGGVGAVRRTLGEFNSGGVIGSITGLVRKYFPGMTITSTLRRGDPGYHGRGMAVDFSNGTDTTPGMQAAARFFHQNYGPGLAELIHHPLRGWQNIKNGRPLNYGAATNQGHRNHVHIASTRPLGPPGMPMVPYAGGGGGGEEFISPAEMIAQMIKPHTDKMKSALDKRPRSGGFIDDLPVKVHDKLLSSARTSMEKAWEKMSMFGGEVNGSLGVVERWRAMVTAALARNGFEPNLRNQNLMLAQIRSESGGNPAITQQIRDVNSGGNEAAGLLQVIPGTFAAYRDPSLPNDRRDPWANMNAALRYYKARYGMDLGRMWGKGHGYHEGGLMPEGQGWFQKTAIAPERVLSPRQTANFEQLTQALTHIVSAPSGTFDDRPGGGSTINVDIHIDGSDDPQRTAEAVREELFKAVR